jgi:peptide-methionine (R)-S-oxide reductase
LKNVIISPSPKYAMSNINKSDDDWKSILTDEQYQVCRQKGTEPPFTGKYTYCKDDGIYRCVCCGNELFGSDTKFDSGTGWPSFYKPIHEDSIKYETDSSYGMLRTEVMCAKCGSHLGHVFDDGPAPTFSRFCINSVSLDLDRKTSRKNSL